MRRTLLVVTRTENLRAALKPLRSRGVHVIEAGTGLAALLVAVCRPVDLAIVDLEAPDMDGPKLAEKLAGVFPTVPVLAITSRDEAAAIGERIGAALDAATPKKQPSVERPGSTGAGQRSA